HQFGRYASSLDQGGKTDQLYLPLQIPLLYKRQFQRSSLNFPHQFQESDSYVYMSAQFRLLKVLFLRKDLFLNREGQWGFVLYYKVVQYWQPLLYFEVQPWHREAIDNELWHHMNKQANLHYQ